ncbi:lanthionine synthetase C family protein [Streptomyces sp. NPDC088337]|uniref:lanthionine synthetase C family protein n=1 Tax=unclassified Streptomyces TaxID=2593676 RepID=UPI0038100B06
MTGVAKRLEQPDVVVREMFEKGGREPLVRDEIRKVWAPASLSYGYPGISLLFSELGHRDDYYRPTAHKYLQLSLEALRPTRAQGLFDGLPAVAFSLRAAQHTNGDYRDTLTRLDALIDTHVSRVLEYEQRRIEQSAAGTSFRAYDVVTGLTGVGRYLLLPAVPRTGSLKAVISYLVSLTDDLTIDSTRVPGWWVSHASAVELRNDLGHLNFGLAHGAAGMLSFLSLAWEAGERTAGHDEAIQKVVGWFVDTAVRDEHGVRWPATLTLNEHRDPTHTPPRTRPSWCYGSPGIARALQMAGHALGNEAWLELADQAVQAALRRLELDRDLREAGLCHGWAGLLHILRLMSLEKESSAYNGRIPSIRSTILDAVQADAPFSFRVIQSGDAKQLNIPGFMEGASGTALALLATLQQETVTHWDSALLLT